ncbi:MAG: NAD(P)H-dependent oxidoreductase [Acidibacillus sp.]|uniref:NAD(P)H-dependent FMN reductase n=1 Tax=Sulfoacidibacillus ferrooxidans TaxID=2005001 RepID=A0A9X1V851_9BACL|nr:NAD(P)H-dependent oxidoreductase [Sulfoacidibacillus ferrooxidans]MCI0183000.1 NAD(P)H-dependent FMN reductase [Sulfoacidibacillus ferrooxidans]MCY0892656.1 NAD(P)H-dependent oxidoreductase [Acidibacillus sp.]
MSESKQLHIVGISGSLRKNSYNTKLLTAASELLPSNVKYTTADISNLPLYNQDLENELPASIEALVTLAKSADAFIFVTPEYNFTISAALKNSLEWLSRSTFGSPLARKPVAITGATLGAYGTSKAQVHLRDIIHALDMRPVSRPEVLISFAAQKFSEDGKLTDDVARDFLKQLMDNLIQWTNQLNHSKI